MIPGSVTVGYVHPGEYTACFAESLIDLLFYDAYGSQRITSHAFGKLANECGSGGIVAGRNDIAKVVLDKSESEWLWFIDADMGFAPDTVDRLVDAADPELRPVVGGLAFAQKKDGHADFYGIRYRAQPTLYDFRETDDAVGMVPRFDYPRNELVNVGATGGACLLIHRLALGAVRDKYGEVWFDTITHPKGSTFSEDLSFCIRLAACDIPIHVHTGVKTTHDKGGVFLDEDFYDRQQAAKLAQGGPIKTPQVYLVGEQGPETAA